MASVPFNNLITFSRGSNATLTGSNGLIQWAPNNLLTFSEQFDNAAWAKSGATISANTAAAPDGTTTADKLVEDTGTTNHVATQTTSGSGLLPYSYSIFVKAAGRTRISVWLRGSSTANRYEVGFDLSTVSVITGSLVGNFTSGSATITAVGNDWYRCTATATTGAGETGIGASTFLLNAVATPNTPSYTGDGVSGAFIWGAQLELGSAATTYNSTTVKNLLGFSEAFDNAAWTKTRVSIVTGAQANPVNGAFNAQKLMEDTTASNTHLTSQAFTALAIPYVVSVYAKKAERQRITLRENSASGDAATFDLNSGTVVANFVGGVGSIQSVGNGWYRCSVLFTATAGGRSVAVLLNTNTGSGFESYTGDGNSGVYIYGAQLSDSASLDPYVPTPAAAPSSTAYYGPRFDYDPVTLAPKGLLVEEARTNLLTYSEDYTNAAWTKNSATVTANAGTAPDGTTNADKVALQSGQTVTDVFQPIALSAGTYTLTGYAKAVEYNLVTFALFTNAGPSSGVYIAVNLASGVEVSSGPYGTGYTLVSKSITPVGNGWYRITLTATVPTTTVAARTSSPYVLSGSGNGTNGILGWGAQLEAGAFATSYIPTVASTVTRSADVATINGSLFSQWYGQTEGTIVAVATPAADLTNSYAVAASDGSTNEFIGARYASPITAGAYVIDGGVIQFGPTGFSSAPAASHRWGLGYKVNDFALSVDGATPQTDTSGTIPTVNQLALGGAVGATQGAWRIRSIDYIPARAADFQLQALTALSVVDYNFLQTAAGDQLVDGNGDALYSIPIFG